MRKPGIDDLLSDSRPAKLSTAAGVQPRLTELVEAARPDRAPRVAAWRRKRVIVPAAAFLVLATTAGGAVAMWAQDHDMAIPVSYTTDTGSVITCTFAVTAASTTTEDGTWLADASDVAALRVFMQENDWTGIGQEAYAMAIDESWTPPGGFMPESERLNRALSEVVAEQIPASLLGMEMAWGAGSDCKGELH